jgi:hypothetical protein
METSTWQWSASVQQKLRMPSVEDLEYLSHNCDCLLDPEIENADADHVHLDRSGRLPLNGDLGILTY